MQEFLTRLIELTHELSSALIEKGTLDSGVLQAELEAFHECTDTTVTAKDRYAKYATIALQQAVIEKQAQIDSLKCKIALLNRLVETNIAWLSNPEPKPFLSPDQAAKI